MSALVKSDAPPVSAVTASRHAPPARAVGAESPVHGAVEESPITSAHRMLAAVAISLLLALVANARAIVHDSTEMPDGAMRALTLDIGHPALRVAEYTHLTWPRDQLDALLGNRPQPAIPPLLASMPLDVPNPRTTEAPTTVPTAMPTMSHARVAGPSPVATARQPAAIHHADQPVISRAPAPETGRRPLRHATPSRPAGHPVTRHPAQVKAVEPPVARPIPPARPRHAATPVVPRATMGHAGATASPRRSSATAPPPKRTPTLRRGPKHRMPSLNHQASRRPLKAGVPSHRLRIPTASHPLRLLVTGDSLTGYLGPILVDKAAATGPVVGFVDTHNGTGLTRPDFVDWSLVAAQQMASDHPDAVVVMMGGNDFQNMTLPNGAFFQAGTPDWTREYQRRAAICMRIWSQGGSRRVYWLSMVPARDPGWARDDAQINIALRRAAAQVPGAEYLDILGPVTNHGHYADFIYDGHGQPILVREPDGVHLNLAGSAIVADEVLRVLKQEWRLGTTASPSGQHRHTSR